MSTRTGRKPTEHHRFNVRLGGKNATSQHVTARAANNAASSFARDHKLKDETIVYVTKDGEKEENKYWVRRMHQRDGKIGQIYTASTKSKTDRGKSSGTKSRSQSASSKSGSNRSSSAASKSGSHRSASSKSSNNSSSTGHSFYAHHGGKTRKPFARSHHATELHAAQAYLDSLRTPLPQGEIVLIYSDKGKHQKNAKRFQVNNKGKAVHAK